MTTNKARQYVMEHEGEAKRLEAQSTLPGYLLGEELEGVPVKPGARILDAGCGSGLAARYLAERHPDATIEGCDVSALRLQSAKNIARETGFSAIRFFESPLEAIAVADDHYDFALCRYVFEHLADARLAARELFRVVRPGGSVRVIDFDGIIYNLYPMSAELSAMCARIREGLGSDLEVGRKIPQMMHVAGFREVSWKATVEDFQGARLESERQLTDQRLTFAAPLVSKILGSETKALRFRDLYLEEMMKPGATLFYNKFVVTATK